MSIREMNGGLGWVWWLAAIALTALGPACSSGDDDSTPSAGGSSGGSMPGSGGTAQGGSAGAMVDCQALCGQIKALCAGNPQIDDTWISVCESACGARVQVAPELAAEWQTCVNAATDCSAGVQCVATTSGSGGSAGSK